MFDFLLKNSAARKHETFSVEVEFLNCIILITISHVLREANQTVAVGFPIRISSR